MSTTRLQPCVDLNLSNSEFVDIVGKAKDWALMHGISMRGEPYNSNQIKVAPFTLIPSCFPKREFERAKNIQKLLNELIHKVAYNYNFLRDNLKGVIETDVLTAKLFEIYECVYREGFSQNISLGLLRSDYLLHNGNAIKQVELNTIASSFGGLSSHITKYHRYILQELGHSDKLKNIPDNNVLTGLSNGLVRAWKLYQNKQAVILFIVENVTYNICDQRFLEFQIRQICPEIKVVRRSLKSLITCTNLGTGKELIVDNLEVAVVYFRSGYSLDAYPTNDEWSVRLTIERSRSIKCPSIQYHLAGTKKIQQALASPGALSQFIKDEESIKQIKQVFTGLYSLDFNTEGESNVDRGIAEPHKFVLKPQREGGGNNIYDEEVKEKLMLMKNLKERSAWILMDRIIPPIHENYLIHANQPTEQEPLDMVSELGVYGVIIGNESNIMYNEEVGHVLRTKRSTVNEGGIIAGFGSLDSPYLTD